MREQFSVACHFDAIDDRTRRSQPMSQHRANRPMFHSFAREFTARVQRTEDNFER